MANQRQGQQAHFRLELTLDIGDDGGALLVIEYGGINNKRRWRNAAGGGPRELLLFAQQINVCPQGPPFLLWVHTGACPEGTSEAKKQNGKGRGDDNRDFNTTLGHRPHSNSSLWIA